MADYYTVKVAESIRRKLVKQPGMTVKKVTQNLSDKQRRHLDDAIAYGGAQRWWEVHVEHTHTGDDSYTLWPVQ